MKILFLTIGKLNSVEDSGIYPDLLKEFRDNGHDVYIISPREKRLDLPTEHSVEEGVNFLRVKIGNITKVNLVEKGISTIMIENLFLKELKKYYANIKFDLVLYSTPPITFDKVIRYVKKRDGASSYLLLKDIFPQNAVDLNILNKKGPFYWYFRYKEKNLYRNSDFIGCMSKANVDYVLKHNSNINPETVEVCPNSIEPMKIQALESNRGQIRIKYDVPIDKTIFIYGGNLGKPQGIDFLINCIRANEENERSYFLIVGSGTEFRKLENYFDEENPKNAKLLSQLPKNDYEVLANSCDVGLIFLDKRFTIPNFPSRLLSYMQASMPVLAATDINTDIGKVIENGNFGYWCESGNIKGFNQLVNKLCDGKLRVNLGKNARDYLENHYTVKHSYEIIMNHFNKDEKR
jgi:glycosyltransferase involved in cell wall biosynthesis